MHAFFYYLGMIAVIPLVIGFFFAGTSGKPRPRYCRRCGTYHALPPGPNCPRR